MGGKGEKECFVTVMGGATIEPWVVGPAMEKHTLMFSSGHQRLTHGAKCNPREIGAVHSGLAKKWSDLRYFTLNRLQKEFKAKTCNRLTVAGYGTGGALARCSCWIWYTLCLRTWKRSPTR